MFWPENLMIMLLILAALLLAAASAQPMNILFILSDDLGVGDVGAYTKPAPPNGQGARTPRLDAFASRSLRFDAAYAGAPVCAPSRYVLMTGRHAGHIPHWPFPPPRNSASLDNTSTTIAHVLQEAGYSTALIGKWGLDDGNPKPSNSTPPPGPGAGVPLAQGFD